MNKGTLSLFACAALACTGSARLYANTNSPPKPLPTPSSDKADWWSFKPATRPTLPKISDKTSPRNPIDLFVQAKLQEQKLAASPEADKRTLIRRLSFDLTGLPPTPED